MEIALGFFLGFITSFVFFFAGLICGYWLGARNKTD